MGELEFLVNPRLGFSRKFRGEFSGRKHHLVISIRQVVAVHIGVIELVIQSYLLSLLIHLQQRAPVP